MKQWRHYLEGAKHETIVYSDYQNLQYFISTKVLNRRQVRWYEELSSYNFKIHYRKGSENARADALSRRSDFVKGEVKMKGPILQKNADSTLGRTQRVCATTIVNDTMSKSIRVALLNDTLAADVLSDPEQYEPQWAQDDGMLLFQGLLYVPTPCRKDVIRSCHDSALAGHEGIEKTIARIASNYYFPGMKKDVTSHIAQCNTCQTTKHARHRPYGLLQPLQVANRPWQSVSLDFIVKLPKS